MNKSARNPAGLGNIELDRLKKENENLLFKN